MQFLCKFFSRKEILLNGKLYLSHILNTNRMGSGYGHTLPFSFIDLSLFRMASARFSRL